MKTDLSYGIIPVHITERHGYEVFIIRHLGGHWSFPKGHPNQGETPLETAMRELHEETALQIKEKLLSEAVLTEQYSFRSGKDQIVKTVQYFIAEVVSPFGVEIDRSEAIEGKWVEINEAPMHLTFEEARRICREAAQILQT